MTCLSITTRGTVKEQIKWIFRLYDINGDGMLQIHEILEILRSANLEVRFTTLLVEVFAILRIFCTLAKIYTLCGLSLRHYVTFVCAIII